MNFTIYKTSNGEIIQSGHCPDSDYLLQQIPEGCAIIALESKTNSQYVENETVFDKPAQPTQFHVFDYESKQWVENADIAKQYVIRQRNTLLYQSDWTQIPNNPLTEEKQQQWSGYRQALRDITMQPEYPFNVIWPTQPE